MAENSGELKPRPEIEVLAEPVEGSEALKEQAHEKRTQSEASSAKQTPQFTPPTVHQPVQASDDPGGLPSPKISSPQKHMTSDLDARESDLIEKQWVERAKTIVAQTQDDPFTQKRQMSRVKADYIKKRFDKTIPADDAVAT